MLEVMVERLWCPDVSAVRSTAASDSKSLTFPVSSWHCRKMAAILAVPDTSLLRAAILRRSVTQVRRVLCEPPRHGSWDDSSARDRIWLRNRDPDSPERGRGREEGGGREELS